MPRTASCLLIAADTTGDELMQLTMTPARALIVLALAALAFRASYIVVASSAGEAEDTPLPRDTNTRRIQIQTATDARRTLQEYQNSVRPDLFHETQYTTAASRPLPALPAQQVPVAEVNPLDDFVYSGLVTLNGRKMALIENRNSHSGRFLSAGDRFLDGRVVSASPSRIVFKFGAGTRALPLRQDYSLVPLDRSAPFLTAKPTAKPAAVAQPAAQPNQPVPQSNPLIPDAANQPASQQNTAPPVILPPAEQAPPQTQGGNLDLSAQASLDEF